MVRHRLHNTVTLGRFNDALQWARDINAVCKKLGMNQCPEGVEYLYDRYYQRGRTTRASDARDLLETVASICRFRRIPVQLTRELIAEAAASFIREFK